MLKNLFRILIIFITLILVLAGIVLLVLRLSFPESRLRSIVINGLRGYTQRDVAVAGVTVGLSGVAVTDLSIAEYPGFKFGTFLSVKRFALQFEPFALLKHRIMVNRMTVDSPKLSVVLRKDHTSSFDNLVGSSNGNKYAPFLLLITDCTVVDGQIVLRDTRWNRYTVTANKVALELRNVSLVSPFPFHVAAVIEKHGVLHIDAKGSGDVRGDMITIDRITITSNGSMLTIAGTIGKISSGIPVFHLTVAGDRTVLDRIEGFIPGASALQFGISPRLNVTLSGTADNVTIRFNKI
jgi:uncharacterized protein involved in outer membrane biogenesis